MRFGLLLPQSNWVASRSAIRDAAQAAEDLGFDSVSVHDHIQYNGWFLASGSREPATTSSSSPTSRSVQLGFSST